MKTIRILGVDVAVLDRLAALDEIGRLYGAAEPAHVAYANGHTLNLASKDHGYRNVLQRAALVLNDGSGLAMAARLKGRRFLENLNGSDFNPLIVGRAAMQGWPVYFLGGADGIAQKAAERLAQRFSDLKVAGTHHGYFDEPGPVVEEIRHSGAGVVMVAMGNPLQEMFIDRHLAGMGAQIGIGVGGFFDFMAGRVPRAPAWMTKFGVEWTYRLAQEPGRMWKRYILGNPAFLARVLSERVRKKGPPAAPSE